MNTPVHRMDGGVFFFNRPLQYIDELRVAMTAATIFIARAHLNN